MDITYLPNTQKIINAQNEIRKDLMKDYHYTDIPIENFPVDNIQMLYFMVCLEPKSIAYGHGSGVFIYKDGRVFQFHYNIHTPYSKGPHISNTMDNIEEIIWQVRHDIGLTWYVNTHFGNQAFWMHTPMDCLDEEAKTLRTLMKSLQAYCRKEDYCKKLRKLDKAHEKWEEEQRLQVTIVKTGHKTVNVISKKEQVLWCNNQTVDSKNQITCLAHLTESRALTCPYSNNEQRLKAKHPCLDYKEREE